jgi:prophage regulatory protein
MNAITAIDASERLLRRGEVERLVGLSRSTIYQKVAKGTFPAPVKIGSHAVRWRESDLRRWMGEL